MRNIFSNRKVESKYNLATYFVKIFASPSAAHFVTSPRYLIVPMRMRRTITLNDPYDDASVTNYYAIYLFFRLFRIKIRYWEHGGVSAGRQCFVCREVKRPWSRLNEIELIRRREKKVQSNPVLKRKTNLIFYRHNNNLSICLPFVNVIEWHIKENILLMSRCPWIRYVIVLCV